MCLPCDACLHRQAYSLLHAFTHTQKHTHKNTYVSTLPHLASSSILSHTHIHTHARTHTHTRTLMCLPCDAWPHRAYSRWNLPRQPCQKNCSSQGVAPSDRSRTTDPSQSYLFDITYLWVTWLIHERHDSFKRDVTQFTCVTWLIHGWHESFMGDMTHSCVTWLILEWHDSSHQ